MSPLRRLFALESEAHFSLLSLLNAQLLDSCASKVPRRVLLRIRTSQQRQERHASRVHGKRRFAPPTFPLSRRTLTFFFPRFFALGGLVNLNGFSGLKSLLSGPAGGVVGLCVASSLPLPVELEFELTDFRPALSGSALTAYSPTSSDPPPVIGLDIGGTSTDVSRYAGRFETVYETTTAGITINSAQLDINTVAAGGGSCLTFRNGLFLAGPVS